MKFITGSWEMGRGRVLWSQHSRQIRALMIYPCLPVSLVTTYPILAEPCFPGALCHVFWQLGKLLFILKNSADISSLPHEELSVLFQRIVLLPLVQTPYSTSQLVAYLSPPENTESSPCKDCLLQSCLLGALSSVSTEWAPVCMALFQLALRFI